jgi:imidazoleglycerol phosphate synthase glutamine amidotransferase subunit HisH
MPKVYLLDYVAGNVRSLVNAIEKVGYTVEWIRSPEDIAKADVSESYTGNLTIHADTLEVQNLNKLAN